MKGLLKTIVVGILTWEAKLLLRRVDTKIIAITGSVGKTSTKDAIYAALKDAVHARKSERSFNSELGVPLTILGLDNKGLDFFGWIKNIVDGALAIFHTSTYPNVLVLEVGVDRPGDMAALTSWLKPQVVVITRLPDVPTHVEQFSSPEAVIEEKLLLLEALDEDGVFVYNHDDERVRQAAEGVRQKAVGYSRYSQSHFQATGDEVVYEAGRPVGIEFTLTHLEKAALMRVNGSLGVQHAYNFAAAAAVASQFGVLLEDAMASLKHVSLPPGRMKVLRGIKDTLIIDDTYNSSPTAAERSLQTLRELTGGTRKVAILGDMLELGRFSVREHERVGEDVAASADFLITVGVRARKIAEAAMEAGMSEKCVLQYDLLERARKEIREVIEEGDWILVKASQGIRLEKLVAEIMLDAEQKGELLVRQSVEWHRR